MLDTSQLVRMSRDYWITDQHNIVRETVDELAAANWYIGLTFTHVAELVRHHDDRVVNNRLDFLRLLPHVAWIRPYDGNWFPGGIVDVQLREIRHRLESESSRLDDLVGQLRPSVWETGTGEEIIQKDFPGWEPLREQAREHLQDEIYIASIARPDVGRILDMTIDQLARLPVRPKEERARYAASYATELRRQLCAHGDRRLTNADDAATSFALDALERVERAEQNSLDPIASVLSHLGIDEQRLNPRMKVEDFMLLTIFAGRLSVLRKRLPTTKQLTLEEIGTEDLPSWLVIRELTRAHWREVRVKASNLGDADIAGVGLYADVCIVDKHTHEHLRQSHKRIPLLNTHLQHYFKTAHYRDLPNRVANVGASI